MCDSAQAGRNNAGHNKVDANLSSSNLQTGYLGVQSLFTATHAKVPTAKRRDYFDALLLNKEMVESCLRKSQGKNSGKAE